MAVKYSVWKNEETQKFEIVMWDGKIPTIIKCGIKDADRARKIAEKYQAMEQA